MLIENGTSRAIDASNRASVAAVARTKNVSLDPLDKAAAAATLDRIDLATPLAKTGRVDDAAAARTRLREPTENVTAVLASASDVLSVERMDDAFAPATAEYIRPPALKSDDIAKNAAAIPLL